MANKQLIMVNKQLTEKFDYQGAAELAASKYSGQRVIFVADIHPLATITHNFASALAYQLKEKGVNSVGFETLSPLEGQFIKALEKGEISRNDFIEAMTPDLDIIDKEFMKQFLGNIADLAISGVHVHALGTLRGVFPHINTNDRAKLADDNAATFGTYYLEEFKFKKTLANLNPAELKQAFENYAADIDKKFNSLSDTQKTRYVEAIQYIRDQESSPDFDPQDYKEAMIELFKAQSDLHLKYTKTEEKIYTLPEGAQMILMDQRYEADEIISDKIQNVLNTPETQSMIVVYGAAHTLHPKDLDSRLRDIGISPLIFDVNVGKKDLCEIAALNCTDLTGVMSWLEKASAKDNDRYAITLPPNSDAQMQSTKPETHAWRPFP